MRRVWLARLESPQTPPGLLLLAVQAVALTKLAEAGTHLSRLAMDGNAHKGIRLEAARVLTSSDPQAWKRRRPGWWTVQAHAT